MVKSCFYHLRLLAKVKPVLSGKNFETVMHAFVTSRLDYCNSLYIGASQTCVTRLQLVQNAAARLLKGKRKSEHITPILISLHWLPSNTELISKSCYLYLSLCGTRHYSTYLNYCICLHSLDYLDLGTLIYYMFLELDLKTGVIAHLRSSARSYGIAFRPTLDLPNLCQLLNLLWKLTFFCGFQYSLILIGIDIFDSILFSSILF